MAIFKNELNLFKDNPIIQRQPKTQREWSEFIQELSEILEKGRNGQFTPSFNGFSSDPTDPVVYWNKTGSVVTLLFSNSLTGTSDGVTFTITNLPEFLRPSESQIVPMVGLVDNGVESWGSAGLGNFSTITFWYEGTNTNWTGSGNKGFGTGNDYPAITYSLSIK